MHARILEKSEEHLWDKFIASHPLATIHQTSAWGHFQEKISERGKYWIIVLEENSKIIGGTMLIRHRLPKGYCWLYAARGPLVSYSSVTSASFSVIPAALPAAGGKAGIYPPKINPQLQMDELLKCIISIAKKEKAIFLRIDPPLRSFPWHLSFPRVLSFPRKRESIPKFKHSHITHYGFQPEHTLIIDLTKSEEQTFAQMKPKGRYNIRLAEKKGIKIHTADPKNKQHFNKNIDAFYELMQQTAKRDQFYGHNKDFYKIMLETLIPHNYAALYLAEYKNKTIAGIIVAFFKDTATYYYGASSNEYRNVMAPYLLQWHAIKEAKSRGRKFYDLFGIAPENAKNHPWQGVTEFKKKFGGTPVSYIPPQEFAFKKFLYILYRLYKFFR